MRLTSQSKAQVLEVLKAGNCPVLAEMAKRMTNMEQKDKIQKWTIIKSRCSVCGAPAVEVLPSDGAEHDTHCCGVKTVEETE
jgi:hypothetical protein